MLNISDYLFGSSCNFLRRYIRTMILLLLLQDVAGLRLLFDCETLASKKD
jgi:hypothetical protein